MLNRSTLNSLIADEAAEFKQLVDTYVGEAFFFRDVLLRDIKKTPEIRRIIEVGAGIGLLSLLIAREGYEVTAFEPQSAGFGEMRRIRELVLKSWDGPPPSVRWIDDYLGDDLPSEMPPADFGFALNVLEHVPRTKDFLHVTLNAVSPSGRFRMIFPNYLFPYEPHFNIPTLISKKLTWLVFRGKITSSKIVNPVAMWNDLSWPSVGKVRRAAHSIWIEASFSRDAVMAYLSRANTDHQFLHRKGVFGSYILRPLAKIGGILLPRTPLRLLPIIDVTFRRT